MKRSVGIAVVGLGARPLEKSLLGTLDPYERTGSALFPLSFFLYFLAGCKLPDISPPPLEMSHVTNFVNLLQLRIPTSSYKISGGERLKTESGDFSLSFSLSLSLSLPFFLFVFSSFFNVSLK